MFIKKVKKRNGKTEKVYQYLHLVESVRTKNGPRQRLVLNLGNLNIHPSQYKALTRRIEDILTGQRSFITLDKEIEKYARDMANTIFKKRAREIESPIESEYQMVNVNSLEIERPRSLGPEYLCHSIWRDLEMDKFLLEKGISEKVLPVMEALVAGRLIDPGSERYTRQWAGKRSAIYELIGDPLRGSLNSYYRAGDKLYSLKEGLEKHLSVSERNLFSLSEKMVFIDLTNTYFEGHSAKNPKAKRGHSKEGRKDCPLVTLGLIIDELGFAKYSQLFPGNQAEGETLAGMINSMKRNLPFSAKDRTIVIDAGIATALNLKWLKENNYHYIAVNRGKAPLDLDYTQKAQPVTNLDLLTKKIIWKKKNLYEKEIEQEGSYLLRTDRFDLSNAEIWKTHLMLNQIESAFKSMKSFLGLRPNFHQKESRVDTHLFISVLAYHILHIIEYRLRQKGDCRSWATIRNILKTHERSTICYQTKDETEQVHQQFVRVSSGLEPEHLEIYRKLKLSGNPLPRKRMEGKIIGKSINQ